MRIAVLAAFLSLVGVVSSIVLAGSVWADEWVQERPYRDLAVHPSDEMRFGVPDSSPGVSAAWIDVMDRDGVVIDTVQLPSRAGWVTVPRAVDLRDELIVVRYDVVPGDEIPIGSVSEEFISVFMDGAEVSRFPWKLSIDFSIVDVAMSDDWLYLRQIGFHPEDDGVVVLSMQDVLGWGITDVGHPEESAFIPQVDDSFVSISATASVLYVFTWAGAVHEYSADLSLSQTTLLTGWANYPIGGHHGVDGSFVIMTGSLNDDPSCGISVHGPDGSLQDCFLDRPGGAISGLEGKALGFDVDGCGGIIVPEAASDVQGDVVGHKFIPSNRDPGCFLDSLDSIFLNDIAEIGRSGVTKGCNPPSNDRFCPGDFVTRAQMAAFLVRTLGLTDRLDDPFTDDDSNIFESDIERLAAAGITKGCNPPANDMFCPDDPVTRGAMAAFLVRALGYTDDGGGNLFIDDDSSIFENDIDKLRTAGVTRGCNPPANDRFCPNDLVTRGQMAAFLRRALE